MKNCENWIEKGDSVRNFKYVRGAENKTYVLENRDEKAEYDEMVLAFKN